MHESTSSLPRHPWLAFATLAVAALAACVTQPSTEPQLPAPSTISARPTEDGTDDVALQQGFARWVTNFRATARAAGIDEATLHVAFDDVHYLPRVVELDRAQPEFTRTVWDYLDSAVSSQRVALGEDKLLQVRAEVDAAAARYGVPASI